MGHLQLKTTNKKIYAPIRLFRHFWKAIFLPTLDWLSIYLFMNMLFRFRNEKKQNIFFFLFLGGQTFAKNIYQCIFYGFYAHICLPYNLFPFSIMQNRKNPQEFHFGILFRFRSNRKSFSHFTFAALNLAFIMLPAAAALIVFSIVINQAKLVSIYF